MSWTHFELQFAGFEKLKSKLPPLCSIYFQNEYTGTISNTHFIPVHTQNKSFLRENSFLLQKKACVYLFSHENNPTHPAVNMESRKGFRILELVSKWVNSCSLEHEFLQIGTGVEIWRRWKSGEISCAKIKCIASKKGKGKLIKIQTSFIYLELTHARQSANIGSQPTCSTRAFVQVDMCQIILNFAPTCESQAQFDCTWNQVQIYFEWDLNAPWTTFKCSLNQGSYAPQVGFKCTSGRVHVHFRSGSSVPQVQLKCTSSRFQI